MKAKDLKVDGEMPLEDLIIFLRGIIYAEEFYHRCDTEPIKFETMEAKEEKE